MFSKKRVQLHTWLGADDDTPKVYTIGLGGALPTLPIKNIVQKQLVCEGNRYELQVPTATLIKSNPFGRRTLLYHSFLNPCQPIYKGEAGDPGRVKWYAFEPEMS